MYNDRYMIEVVVQFPRTLERRIVCLAVDAIEAEPFEPYDNCKDQMTAAICGGVDEQRAGEIDRDREELAGLFAHKITKAIMQHIKSKDKISGRKIEGPTP